MIEYCFWSNMFQRYWQVSCSSILQKHRIHINTSKLGQAVKDHATLRSLSALIASLPASEHKEFREEFDQVSELDTISLSQYF